MLKKKINKILTDFKKGKITHDQARRLILYVTMINKSATCKLDRLQDQCLIFLHTEGGCANCGHYLF